MYKKVYFMLFNQISDMIKSIEEIIYKAENEEVMESLIKIRAHMIEAQCEAENIIIESDEEIWLSTTKSFPERQNEPKGTKKHKNEQNKLSKR